MTTISLPRLQITVPIVDEKGRPTKAFQKQWNDMAQGIEQQLNDLQAILDQIVIIQAQQAAFDNTIADIIVTFAGVDAGLSNAIQSIVDRLAAAGIP